MATVRLTHNYRFSASHRLHLPELSDEDNQRLFGKCRIVRQGHTRPVLSQSIGIFKGVSRGVQYRDAVEEEAWRSFDFSARFQISNSLIRQVHAIIAKLVALASGVFT